MIPSEIRRPSARLQRVMTGVMSIACLAGFSLCLVIFLARSPGEFALLAGCDGGGCAKVMGSRWSTIFGISVTIPGMLVYAGLMVSLWPRISRMHLPLLGVVAGASSWFIFAQAVLIREFCSECMTLHGISWGIALTGLARAGRLGAIRHVAVTMGGWGLAAFLFVGLAQVYGPVSERYRISDTVGTSPQAAVHGEGTGRKVSFDGVKYYDLATLPMIGRADAPHVLVEYFDYQCPACGIMAGYLDALVRKYPAEMAVVFLPVPLDRSCNPELPTGSDHPGSCEITRLALAVWRENPRAFADFHRGAFGNPSAAGARALALGVMPRERLDRTLADPWIDSLVEANVGDWKRLSKPSAILPKLLIRPKRILQGLPPSEEDFIRAMESELGLSR